MFLVVIHTTNIIIITYNSELKFYNIFYINYLLQFSTTIFYNLNLNNLNSIIISYYDSLSNQIGCWGGKGGGYRPQPSSLVG